MENSMRRGLAQEWVAVTVLAWVAGGLLAELLSRRLHVGVAASLLEGIVIGAVLGVLQRRVLRPHLPISLWWVVATAAVLGLLSYVIAQDPFRTLFASWMMAWVPPVTPPTASVYLGTGAVNVIVGVLLGSVTGALLGTAQWLLLRRERPEAGRWVVANVVGMGAGLAAGAVVFTCLALALTSINLQGTVVLSTMAGDSVRGAVSGAITARTLLRLL